MGEHALGLIMFVFTAGLMVVVVFLRARFDPGTRERRALRNVGTDIWEWFARFERVVAGCRISRDSPGDRR